MLRIGIVGCGNAARHHADALLQLKDQIQIVGCCDIDSISLLDFRKQYCPAADVFTDVGAMLMQLKLDVLLLATWPVIHRDQIMNALDAGIQTIIVEKPLTVTGGEALELFIAAKARNARIIESNAFVYQARFVELEKMITASSPADTMNATFCQTDRESADPSNFELEWRQQRVYGGGVPWEYVGFLITACNHFSRDLPVGVYAYGSRGRYDTITRMHGMIEYLHGGVAFIHSDKQSDAQNFHLRLKGSTVEVNNDCWYLDNGPSNLRTGTNGSFEERSFDGGSDVFLAQWKEFLQCLAKGTEPSVPFIHSVVAMYTLDALVTSVLQQMSVELDIPEPIMAAYEETLEGRDNA
jgi:predicted dehydrogenase